jgi:signal peptide peptidase SppA
VVEAALADLPVLSAARPGTLLAEDRPYPVRGRSAVLSLRGVMIPSGPSWLEWFGYAISERLIERIYAAQTDDDVDELVLEVDSPGGAVLGTEALGKAIAASRKPVVAHVLHMMASAALFAGSQASKIIARPGALIGSIGTYAVLVDSSRQAEQAGVRVHVMRAGEHKGAGTPGAPISERQLAEVQARVDRASAVFIAAVAAGRDMPEARVRELATGATWEADEALQLGLIDGIENMGGASARETHKEGRHMAITEEQHKAALERLAALEAQNKEKDAKLADLGATLGTEKARAEKAAAALAGIQESKAAEEKAAKDALIDEAAGDRGDLAGRVSPATRKAVERFAAHATVTELREYLAELPVIVRRQAAGHGGGQPPSTSRATGARFEKLSADDRRVMQLAGLSETELNFYAQAQCYRADGVIEMVDGREVRPQNKAATAEEVI